MGYNAIPPYLGATPGELQEALGVTRFVSETNWFQTVGGLLIQGGLESSVGSAATVTVSFNAAFPKQCLGVFIQPIGTSLLGFSVDNVTLEDFDLVNAAVVRDFYWWAIGL